MVVITIVRWGYKPTYNVWGPHIVYIEYMYRAMQLGGNDCNVCCFEVHKVVQRRKPIVQERVQHVPKAGGWHMALVKMVLFGKIIGKSWENPL